MKTSSSNSFLSALILCSFSIARVHGFASTRVIPPQKSVAQHSWTRPQARRLSNSARWLSSRAEEAEKLSRKIASSPQQTDEHTTGFDPFDQVQAVIKTEEEKEYLKGFATIGFITLLNASLAPVWHFVFEGANTPPPLFLNAVVSVVALLGLLVGAGALDSRLGSSVALAEQGEEKWSKKSFRGGMELGVWKGLGTTCHIFGMSLTTANHGAFLLQLTTLIVPVLQGLRGEKIPRQIQLAVVLALAGIVAFTQDPTGAGANNVNVDEASVRMGDALVLGAAFFYSLYDIQTFYWGREVPRTELVTIKIGFQALLSCLLCGVAATPEVISYLQNGPDWNILVPTVLWSGLIVNALATFLQVGGMQSVGPTRAQTIFASQPLWASGLNFVFLGEVVGMQGIVGGGAFLGALLLAATAKAPDPTAADGVAEAEL